MPPSRRLLFAAAAGFFAASLVPAPAAASELVGRNARDVRLAVSRDGRTALLRFRSEGRMQRVRAWGAINARPPSPTRPQVGFRLDYSGGRPFADACRPYDGPKLQWLVAACTAPDGSYWAVQSWPRIAALGRPVGAGVWELHLSHWRGPISELTVKLDWAYQRYDHVYGWLTYRGRPVHGFRWTRRGSPLDSYGRNIYFDAYNSAYGSGWRRLNGFLTKPPTGGFCYGVYRGEGEAYRAAVVGPGVTPDVFWQSREPGPYNSIRDRLANAEQQQRLGRTCP